MIKGSSVHTMEIKRLRSVLRDANTKPIARMGRTTKFVIDNNKEIRLVQPDPTGIMLLIPG